MIADIMPLRLCDICGGDRNINLPVRVLRGLNKKRETFGVEYEAQTRSYPCPACVTSEIPINRVCAVVHITENVSDSELEVAKNLAAQRLAEKFIDEGLVLFQSEPSEGAGRKNLLASISVANPTGVGDLETKIYVRQERLAHAVYMATCRVFGVWGKKKMSGKHAIDCVREAYDDVMERFREKTEKQLKKKRYNRVA